MLVPVKSMNYIDADSQNIIALYRSSSQVAVAVDSFSSKQCKAFICGVQDGGLFNIFLALLATDTKQTLIFSLNNRLDNETDYKDKILVSLKFAEKMGFMMDLVNLDYSKALREVIISDTKVIRSIKNRRRKYF